MPEGNTVWPDFFKKVKQEQGGNISDAASACQQS